MYVSIFHHQEKIQLVVDDIRNLGSDAVAFCGDVSKGSDLDSCISSAINKFGRIDVLVNCAGIVVVKPYLQQTEQDFERIMNVNVKGPFLFIQKVLPFMLKQGKGKIINYASIDSFVGEENAAAYVASKGAIKSLTTTVALEFAGKGMNANAICPGQIDTPMLRQFTDGHPEVKEFLIKNTPAKRIGKPEETANAAVFLASDESDFVNGTALVVDGGWLCL